MTLAPDPADLAPPDPSDYRPARRAAGLPGMVWAMVAFGFLCVLAGIVVAVYGPRLWPAPTETVAPAIAAPDEPRPQPVAAPAFAPLSGAAPSGAAAPVEVAALQSRITSLEAVQGRTVDAVTAALTATALSAAADGSRPFEAEAAAAQRAMPMSADVRALARLAVQGAPSRAELGNQFAASAARAVAAQRDPGADAGLARRMLYTLSSVVSIRRVDVTSGSGFDATLARAEQQAASGNLEAALTGLDSLPPQSQAAFAEWRAGAERRVEIDRRVASLRELALAELDRAVRSRP